MLCAALIAVTALGYWGHGQRAFARAEHQLSEAGQMLDQRQLSSLASSCEQTRMTLRHHRPPAELARELERTCVQGIRKLARSQRPELPWVQVSGPRSSPDSGPPTLFDAAGRTAARAAGVGLRHVVHGL